jgi:hypothetical protein
MKPSLLKRHLNTKHPTLKDKSTEYFTRKCEGINIYSAAVTVYAKSSQQALQASYETAQMIENTKKPHTIAETLVIPASITIAEIMFSEKEVVKIKNIPHSNDTIRRRTDEMTEDIIKQITETIIQKKVCFELDETIDIFNCAQLMVFIRYSDDEYEKGIREQIYYCKEFDTSTTGEEIFNLLNEQILKHGLSWEWCTYVCTDGAAAVVG